MTFFWCPKCEKDIYIDNVKLGRILKKITKDQSAEVEALCPKCGLFIGREFLVGMTKKDFERREKLGMAPKNYRASFPSLREAD